MAKYTVLQSFYLGSRFLEPLETVELSDLEVRYLRSNLATEAEYAALTAAPVVPPAEIELPPAVGSIVEIAAPKASRKA